MVVWGFQGRSLWRWTFELRSRRRSHNEKSWDRESSRDRGRGAGIKILQTHEWVLEEGERQDGEDCRKGFGVLIFFSSLSLSLLNTPQRALSKEFSSVESFSCVRLFAASWTAARQASLSITSSWSLLKLMSIESVMPSNHLILCSPLLLLPSTFPSIRVFSNESVLHIRRPKFWSFSISPSNEYSGLISFRMDWLDLFVVQGTLKSLLQLHSSKA